MNGLLNEYTLIVVLLYIATVSYVECHRNYRYIDDNNDDDSNAYNSNNMKANNDYYRFLYKRMKEDAARHLSKRRQNVVPTFYSIPGPFEPLPGRSANADYWPLFPFSSQYSGGLDLDPSTARHIGGDMNIPIPSWGIMDIYGRFYNRIQDTTATFGYQAAPVNMLGLTKSDFIRLFSDPSMHYNRAAQPLIPIAKVPRTMVPMSCRAPMCNPYVHNYALGIEYDFGGHNGVEGDLDLPIPISKDVAYRFPFSGNVYYHNDNLTVTYGQEFGNVDPFYSLFEYQKYLPWLYPEESVRNKRNAYEWSVNNQKLHSKQWRSGIKSSVWKRELQSDPVLKEAEAKLRSFPLSQQTPNKLISGMSTSNRPEVQPSSYNAKAQKTLVHSSSADALIYNPFTVLLMPYYNF